MATFNYYLREPKSTKKTPIVLFVVANGKTKKIKTDQKIEAIRIENRCRRDRNRTNVGRSDFVKRFGVQLCN